MEGVYYELMKTNKKRVIYSYFMDFKVGGGKFCHAKMAIFGKK